MTFRSASDQPERFARSKAVGAHFGLPPKKSQSSEIDRTGRISKVGDAMTAIRHHPTLQACYECLIQCGRAAKVAITACMRKLLVILNASWRDRRPWQPA